jgi:molybdopterin/thiamine biosynthesis adenylyltransferase
MTEVRAMPRKFLHEEIYRGSESVAKLAAPRVTICGAGAIGSHLADNLARQGFRKLRIIDRDRVEEHNISTQNYGVADIGAWKAEMMRNRLFRTVEIEVEAVTKELSERNARSLLKDSDLVIDTFDNSASRRIAQQQCRESGFSCLHVGLHADYCEAIWDEQYRVPNDIAGDVCEYPLARNLVLFAVALGSELVVRYVLVGKKQNFSGTLADFAFSELEH